MSATRSPARELHRRYDLVGLLTRVSLRALEGGGPLVDILERVLRIMVVLRHERQKGEQEQSHGFPRGPLLEEERCSLESGDIVFMTGI